MFDSLRGACAEGLRVELFRLGRDAAKRCSVRLGSNGALGDPSLDAGEYEVEIHLGEYYGAIESADPARPFLQSVKLRLGIAEPHGSYDLSLRITPFGICMPGA